MSFRETINQNQPIVIGVVLLIIGIAVYTLFFSGSQQPGLYYTIDDGQTFFEHDPIMPPFTYRGSEAVQAMVYSCDGGENRFVGYMLKYRDEETRAAAQRALENKAMLPDQGLLVKKPGEGEWVPRGGGIIPNIPANAGAGAAKSSQSGDEIATVKCPEGTGPALLVTPR